MMPSCCMKLAMLRATPQIIPPLIVRSRRKGSSVPSSLKGFPAILSNIKQQRKRKIVAKKLRAQLKVKGSAYSPPTLWAIKAVPQIKAQRVSISMPLRLFLLVEKLSIQATLLMQNNITLSIVPFFREIYKGDMLFSWLKAAFFVQWRAKHFLSGDVGVNCKPTTGDFSLKCYRGLG